MSSLVKLFESARVRMTPEAFSQLMAEKDVVGLCSACPFSYPSDALAAGGEGEEGIDGRSAQAVRFTVALIKSVESGYRQL